MYPNWFLGRPVVSAICEQLFPNVTERTARDVLLMWSAYKLKQRQSTWEWRPSWNSIQTFYFGFDFRNSSRDIYSLSQLRAADTYWLPFDLTPSHVVVHEVSNPKDATHDIHLMSGLQDMVGVQPGQPRADVSGLHSQRRCVTHSISLSQSFALESLINSSLDDE